jgi:NhaA family Na+:H+ antiporter
MATDIAFTLAILRLLGKRIPLGLKVFLTAFAIIDDIAAVLVIAVFYSGDIDWTLLLYALAIIGFLMLLSRLNKYSKILGILAAIIVWFLFLKAGIHPTIAGVLMAFTIPIRKKVKLSDYSENLAAISDRLCSSASANDNIILTKEQLEQIDNLEDLTFQVRSPLQHLEHKLHNWAGYFILPIFALSNAGVVISTDSVFDMSLITNIAIALFVGKFLGVALLSYLGIKLKITELPTGVSFKQILGIAAIAGVGFTMSIFIGNLAFAGDMVQSNSVKVGIIIGSLIAGVVGYLLLRFSSNKPEPASQTA